jgi:HD superfamily phosphohydrolase
MESQSEAYDSKVKVTVFNIPSSGLVRLFEPEMAIVRDPAFQRLSGLKQLGTSYVVFRGAVHARFEHSLGALHEAERIIGAINRNPSTSEQIEGDAHRLVRLCALLHDICHIPFGHTLEDEFGLLERHDRNPDRFTRLFVDTALSRHVANAIGCDGLDELVRILQAVSADSPAETARLRYPYIADIVAGTVSADVLDYVQRDSLACGISAALGDRFLDSLVITSDTVNDASDRRRIGLDLEKRGMPRPDVESEVLTLLHNRYHLVERVFFHHAKNSASAMLARSVTESGLIDCPAAPGDDAQLDRLSDESLLLLLAHPEIAKWLGVALHRRTMNSRQLAADLAQAVSARQLYKIAYLGVYDDLAEQAEGIHSRYSRPDARIELEDSLANRAGLDRGSVLVHVPSPKMLLKLADVRVLSQGSQVTTLEHWDRTHSGRASALNEAHRRLWRVTVYVHPAVSLEQRELVRSAAATTFGSPSRYGPSVSAAA